jgi:hypothetical protein
VGVCREFIGFCRRQQLFGGELLAIDGTRVEAVASRKQVVTPKRLAEQMTALDQKIGEYLLARMKPTGKRRKWPIRASNSMWQPSPKPD